MYVKDNKELRGNPLIERLDGEVKATLNTILDPNREDNLEDYGIFQVVLDPPEGQQWNGEFVDNQPVYEPIPAAPVPQVVTMRQARLALLESGLLVQIENSINALEEPDKSTVLIEWEYAQTVDRSHAWVQALTTQLQLTEQQLDDLFTLASEK